MRSGRLWRREPSGAYLAEARAEIEAFSEATGADVDWAAISTRRRSTRWGASSTCSAVAIPERGEVLTHPEGHEFEIVEADRKTDQTPPGASGAPQRPAAPPQNDPSG